jgi:DUF4097 and DUF4098 domain-containing protein YvlB
MSTRIPLCVAAALCGAALAGAPTAQAQNRIDTTIAVRGAAQLSVTNQSGEVHVRVWDRTQIRVTAEYDRARVEVTATGNRVSVRSSTWRGDNDVSYAISVPSGTAVEVNGVSTDVTVSGVCGEVTIQTVSGEVTASCLTGDASIQSVSGDVALTDVRGAVDVGSTSGEVVVRGARGDVTAHAVSGDLTLEDITGSQVSGETVSGDLSYGGRIADAGRYHFQSHSGDVTLRIAGTVNATVEVSTFSGDLESDFPVQLPPGTRVSAHEWQFQLGTGGARIKLESFSGTIELRRGSATTNREE